mmetsp:Transcript_12892/g.38374  ORF Transcript_12892/g.38374 Transcript_12892/m.38374 type:complete len:257 (-) Transcript_12892:587-1357(-)
MPWTCAALPCTLMMEPGCTGLGPMRSTRNFSCAPEDFRASLPAPIAASMSSCVVTCVMPTPAMQSPSFQPNDSASGFVKPVTTRFSMRRPSDLSSPKRSATTMATLCVVRSGPSSSSSPAAQLRASCVRPPMPVKAAPTKSVTMSTASSVASPTVLMTPFSASSSPRRSMSLLRPLMPSPTVSTTAFTPSPTRSTASSAVAASSPSALSVMPRVSAMRPTPPKAAPPTNLAPSPTMRPASSTTAPASSRRPPSSSS